MAKVVKPWVKYATKGIAVLAVLGVLYFLAGVSGVLPSSDGKGSGLSLFGGSDDENIITFSSNTFIGFTPIVYLNNGLEPTEDCILFKEYGIKARILIQDNFEACRNGLINGDTEIVYGTLDAYPVEMGEGSQMAGTKFISISNWSVGADAIVCNYRINTVADLIGKTVCCSKGTASHTLLLNALDAAGIGPEKVNDTETNYPDKINIKYCESGIDAANIYRGGQCDAAVVYSPDDEDLIKNIKGTKMLVSTKQASNIICDGWIVKKEWLDNKDNREKLKKFLSAVLWANSEMNNNPEAVKKACKVFSDNYDYTNDLALECIDKIRFTTLEDEKNFFGINAEYAGMTGQELYSKMARTYAKLNLVTSPMSWTKVSDTSVLEELIAEGTVKGDQSAEKAKTFSAPTEDMATKVEMSAKKLSIEFPTNSSALDANAKSLIDREFVSIAKQFAGSRVRIEGNTDGTGTDAVNLPLSKARAQAVADYLVKEYGFDTNRFIVIGNGSKKAKIDGVKGDNHAYRTTDFELIND